MTPTRPRRHDLPVDRIDRRARDRTALARRRALHAAARAALGLVTPRRGRRRTDPRALVRAGAADGTGRGIDHRAAVPRSGTGTIARRGPAVGRVWRRAARSSPSTRRGALDRDEPRRRRPPGRRSGSAQPVTIDESSATIDVAGDREPRRRAHHRLASVDPGSRRRSRPPASAPASSTTASGWILTNRHVVEGSDEMQVELNDGQRLTAAPSTASTP